MSTLRHAIIAVLTLLAFGCSTTPAPVIDRTPAGKPAAASKPTFASKTSSKPANGKNGSDWRPDTHTVKKGDTLFSIGLEYGYDYKDIARVNNIEAPYIIKIGQTLKLADLKDKPGIAEVKQAEPAQQEDGVITYPINTDSTANPAIITTAAATAAAVAINEPKAIREPYSEAALKTAIPTAKPITSPTTTAKVDTDTKAVAESKEIKPQEKAETKPEIKPAAESAGALSWAWPTKGKVISGFNDGGNKGIDIAGTKGQPILAAAPGKVIYSGSDLRGYGKLVIVKHNNTYLSVYANNSNILVKEGQQVSTGQKIAEMGDTDSNIVKLHFEIRQQGKSVDPAKFLASN